MAKLFTSLILFTLLNCHYSSYGQFYNIDEEYLTDFLNGDNIDNSMLSSAPFLRKSVDAGSGGLGNTGIASSSVANAMYFNASKLALSDSNFGLAVNFAPMWSELGIGDRFITSIVAYKKLGNKNTLGIEAKHFSSGTFSKDPLPLGYFLGKNTARESLLSFALARKWSNRFSSALSIKYIYSNIGYTSNYDEGVRIIAGQSFAGDLSFTYKRPIETSYISSNLILGLAINNLGPQITYSTNSMKEYLPANIGLGVGWAIKCNEKNSISLLADFNKLLVPSPNDFSQNCQGLLCSHLVKNSFTKAAWRSFYDANGGLSEELSEIYYSFGIEYEYNEKLFLRTGYLYEHPDKGNRQTFSVGFGYGFRKVITDLSLQFPLIEKEVHDNRFRFSINYSFLE